MDISHLRIDGPNQKANGVVYRIIPKNYSNTAFVPPGWMTVDPNNPSQQIQRLFSGRFDDPAVTLPESEKYRVIYVSSDPFGAMAETLASSRPPINIIASYPSTTNKIGFDLKAYHEDTSVSQDERNRRRSVGVIKQNWLQNHVICSACYDPMPFFNYNNTQTIEFIRNTPVLAKKAISLGFTEIEHSTLYGSGKNHREFTKSIGRFIFETGNFRGINYRSHHGILNETWECWGIYITDGEVINANSVSCREFTLDSIKPIAKLFGLGIEETPGGKILYTEDW